MISQLPPDHHLGLRWTSLNTKLCYSIAPQAAIWTFSCHCLTSWALNQRNLRSSLVQHCTSLIHPDSRPTRCLAIRAWGAAGWVDGRGVRAPYLCWSAAATQVGDAELGFSRTSLLPGPMRASRALSLQWYPVGGYSCPFNLSIEIFPPSST